MQHAQLALPNMGMAFPVKGLGINSSLCQGLQSSNVAMSYISHPNTSKQPGVQRETQHQQTNMLPEEPRQVCQAV